MVTAAGTKAKSELEGRQPAECGGSAFPHTDWLKRAKKGTMEGRKFELETTRGGRSGLHRAQCQGSEDDI